MSYNKFRSLDGKFHERKMSSFWNGIRQFQRKRVNSCLQATQFADFYAEVMQDSQPLTSEQARVSDTVREKVNQYSQKLLKDEVEVTVSMVELVISKLKRNSSAGHDGITAEHLIFGKSNVLLSHLSRALSLTMTYSIVPDVLTIGIIIPILKKSFLNPNVPANYRPITVSSIYAKMIELLMIPRRPSCQTES